MKIGTRTLGPDQPVFLASEIGVTALGDVGRAKRMIEATAEAGADAVKFICADPDKIMASRGSMYEYEMFFGETVGTGRWVRPIYDLLKEGVFPDAAWPELAAHAKKCGLEFFVTVTALQDIPMLLPLTAAWKVSCWDIAWTPLIEALRATGKPILVDVGTATVDEFWRLPAGNLPVHAPHPREGRDWNMGRMWNFSFHFHHNFGFSSPGREDWPDYMALGAGACFIEKRLTLRRDEPTGHHHAISLEPDEFKRWVADMRRADAARREDPWGGSEAAWAERRKYDRNAEGLRP